MSLYSVVHFEIEMACMFLMAMILFRMNRNVNKEQSRIIFIRLVKTIMIQIAVEMVKVILNGHTWNGIRPFNIITNIVLLCLGVYLWMNWWVYALSVLKYFISKKQLFIMGIPLYIIAIISIISAKSEWIFRIDENGYYQRGDYYYIYIIVLTLYLVGSLSQLLRIRNRNRSFAKNSIINSLLLFYILPVFGCIVENIWDQAPGMWTMSALSVALVYFDMLEHSSTKDGLTGLNNRHTLEPAFEDRIKEATGERKLYLFMIDLNKFKYINDTFGHTVGDEALRHTSVILKRAVADTNLMLVRYGGDEFLMLGFMDSDEEAEKIKQRIKDSMTAFNVLHDGQYTLSASIGYCIYEEGESLSALIARADALLYKEKKQRRG